MCMIEESTEYDNGGCIDIHDGDDDDNEDKT